MNRITILFCQNYLYRYLLTNKTYEKLDLYVHLGWCVFEVFYLKCIPNDFSLLISLLQNED